MLDECLFVLRVIVSKYKYVYDCPVRNIFILYFAAQYFKKAENKTIMLQLSIA